MWTACEWRLRAMKKGRSTFVFREASESIESKCGVGARRRLKRHFVKDSAGFVHEKDGHSLLPWFDQSPVLLEHFNYLEPVVSALDGNAFVHGAAVSCSATLNSPLSSFGSPDRSGSLRVERVRDWCGRLFIWAERRSVLSASHLDTARGTVRR